MRPYLQHSGPWLMLALALASRPARAQFIEGEVKGFKHAFVDQASGRRTALLSGLSATNLSNEALLIAGPQLAIFTEDGTTNLTITSPECVYNTRTERVHSTNRLQVAAGNGQFSLAGAGFEYRRSDGQLTISNNVEAIIRKDLLTAPPPFTNAAGTLAARPASTNPPPLQVLRIRSERFYSATNQAVFRDSVQVVDPQGELTCGVLTANFSDKGRQLQDIFAERDVVIESSEMRATGETATFRPATDVVELAGRPTWRIGPREGRAEAVVFNRRTQEFHAAGNVEMNLPPGSIEANGFLPPDSSSGPSASAQERQPVMAQAAEFEFRPDAGNTNFNLAVFSGNVRVNAGTGDLNCEKLTLTTSAADNRTVTVVAERRVLMRQGENRVSGDQVVYTAASGAVEVTGHPAWEIGARTGTAEVLVLDFNGHAYRATRNVQMHLPPDSFGRVPWLLPRAGAASHASPVASAPGTPAPGRPIEISADQFESKPDLQTTNSTLAVFDGKVRVNDPDRMTLSCERLTVKRLANINQMESVTAEQDVDLALCESDIERRAHGDKAIYTASTGAVELSGSQGVEILVAGTEGVSRATGAEAVYGGIDDVLRLTGNPVVTTPSGRASGDTVLLDHANTTIRATGNWNLKIKPDTLNKKLRPVLE